jgi:hypothetical protein
MINYTWLVKNFSFKTVDNIPNVLTDIQWVCQAIDNTNSYSIGCSVDGTTPIPFDSSTDFKDYLSLTDEDIWSWVHKNHDRTEIENRLQIAIEEKKSNSH